MKKTLMAVLATVLIAGGAVSAPSASAEEYPGTVVTATDIGGPRKVMIGKAPKSSIYIKSAGNTRPRGTVRVQYLHKASKKSLFKTVAYQGKRITFFGPKLKRAGSWQLRAVFRPKAGSVWRTSKDSYSVKVVRKR